MKTRNRNVTVWAMFVFLLSTGIGYADLANGLAAYYPFNGNANDESGNGNDGTVYGPVLTADRFGNPSSAYSLDGLDDYISIGVPPMGFPTGNAPRTLAGWFLTTVDNHGQWKPVLFYGTWAQARGYGIFQVGWYGTANSLAFGGYSYDWGSNVIINDGVWHHAAISYDGSTIKIYLDGAFLTSGPRTLNTGDTVARMGSIGPGANGGDGFWNGLIDEVALWNRELSQAEIESLFLNGIDIPEPTPCGEDMIIDLVAQVVVLNLAKGISNSLDSKLTAALNVLDDINTNNEVAAINSLQAFINAVEAQSGNHIPVGDANDLIAEAQAIIELLLNPPEGC